MKTRHSPALRLQNKTNPVTHKKTQPALPKEKDFSFLYIILILLFVIASGILGFSPDFDFTLITRLLLIAGLWGSFFLVLWLCEIYVAIQVMHKHLAQLNQKMDFYLSDLAKHRPPAN